MQIAYGLDDMPKPDEMREIGEPWRPYRSVGTWYMWRALGVDVPEQGRGYKKPGRRKGLRAALAAWHSSAGLSPLWLIDIRLPLVAPVAHGG